MKENTHFLFGRNHWPMFKCSPSFICFSIFCIYLLYLCSVVLTWSTYRVYQLLGEAGTYYGVRFGKNIPWVTAFPFGVISDPQYVGSIMSLLACISWVPFQYILLWLLGYVFMIKLESKEDPATRAKPLTWRCRFLDTNQPYSNHKSLAEGSRFLLFFCRRLISQSFISLYLYSKFSLCWGDFFFFEIIYNWH